MIEGGVVSFIRTDHIGRPVYATNAAGIKVWTASYTPFGGVRITGTPLRAPSAPLAPTPALPYPSSHDPLPH